MKTAIFGAYTLKTVSETRSRAREMHRLYLEEQRQTLKSEVVSFIEIIEHEMDKTLQEAKIKVQVRVAAACSLAQNLYDQNKGIKTEKDIQKIIIDALRPIRLDQGGGYYFISDFNGRIKLFADRPEQERTSFLDRQDARGQYVVKDMIRIARSKNEGFYSYHWTKPGRQGNDFEKLAYIKRFPPFDWLIGTGVYLDDLESRMQSTVLQYARTRRFGPNGRGYVFVYEVLNLRGGKNFARVYANPNLPDETGKLISDDYRDVKGKAFRKEFLKGLREQGECYVDYWYQKMDDPEPTPKTSFFKLTSNGRFIVAAGLYQDDLENQILLIKANLYSQLWHGFMIICSIFSATVFLVLLLANRLNKRLKNDFQIFADFFKQAIATSTFMDRKKVKFAELDHLAEFVNQTLSQKIDAEHVLKETQARLNEAQKMAKVGHYVFDIKNNFWSNSSELNHIFGINDHFEKNISGWLQIVHPDYRDSMSEYLQNHVLTHLQKFDMEYQIIDQRTGQEKWAHGLGDLRFDDKHQLIEMFGTIQDITERRLMNESLRLTQFIFDKAAIQIFHMASDGRILNVNEQAAETLGYTVAELSGMTLFDIHPGLTPEDFDEIWQIICTKRQDHFKVFHRHKNGKIFPVEVTANLIEYNKEQFSIAFVRDITEQQQAEDGLRKSEERLSDIVKSMADWIWEVDADGRYLYCSKNVEKILGYSPEEMIGKTPFDFMAPDEARKILEAFEKIVAQNQVITDLENWNLCKDGRKICLLTNGVPILNEKGELLGFRGVDKDITERKQAQREREELEIRLQQAQKMEAIGTLAGGIAHDFNNILTGILGYSQLAMAHIKAPEKATQHLKEIIKGTQRATDLTKQILTFSRQSEYQKHPFKIYIEIKEALKLIRSTIPSTIEIKSVLDSRKRVLADPIKIHQVIMNLCTNAYHSMRKTGGEMTVSLTDVEFSESDFLKGKRIAPGEYVKLSVSDTGHGMDEKTMGKAFEPYFTTKEKGDGTGLGLALVQAIVEEHDGFLDVRSTMGKGTSFDLYFPAVNEEIKEIRMESKEEPRLGGYERIMVVDDEDPVRESCKEFLEDYGYHVQTFRNGVEALERFQANPAEFDLILTDMTMPGITGDRMAEEILKIRPDIPIVLSSGFSDTISQAKAIELGIRRYIQKPILHQDLATIIRDILDQE